MVLLELPQSEWKQEGSRWVNSVRNMFCFEEPHPPKATRVKEISTGFKILKGTHKGRVLPRQQCPVAKFGKGHEYRFFVGDLHLVLEVER